MMRSVPSKRLVAPLILVAALFTAPVAWILLQQGEGALVYLACGASGPPIGVLLGIGALAACLAACGLAWRVLRIADQPVQRFLAQVALGSAAIFALAALVMTAAICLAPSCAR